MQVVGVDSQKLCRFGEATAGLFEGAQDQLFFQTANGVVIFRWSSSGGRGGFHQSFRKVFGENKIGGADDDGTLHGIFQFADVARPVVLHQASARSRRDSLDAAIAFLRIARNEIFGEGLDVFSVLAERWHGDGDNIKTVEEVRSELVLAHRLLQVFVAGRQEADVQLDGSRS